MRLNETGLFYMKKYDNYCSNLAVLKKDKDLYKMLKTIPEGMVFNC